MTDIYDFPRISVGLVGALCAPYDAFMRFSALVDYTRVQLEMALLQSRQGETTPSLRTSPTSSQFGPFRDTLHLHPHPLSLSSLVILVGTIT